MRSGQQEQAAYSAFDIVVMAASAGGIEAIRSLLEALPVDFPTPVVVALHLPPAAQYESHLDELLQQRTTLNVKWADHGERLVAGTVYVSPQDRLTFLDPPTGCLMVTRCGDARVDKPTADPLFQSASRTFGSRTMAVVLSGRLSDGATGSLCIARAGGRVLTQTCAEARFPGMPTAAMKATRVGLAFDCITLAHVMTNLVMIPGAAKWFEIGKAGACAQLMQSF